MFARSLKLPLRLNLGGSSRWQSTAASSSKSEAIIVDVNEKTGISTLTLNQKPVNSMTLEFLKSFCEKMDFLEKEKVKGMILTSSLKNVFSSGLDFNEIYKPEESRINAFWVWFQEAWLKLYGSSFATVALINGHAPAGGCVFALSCEYRVMLPGFTIGLNEAPVGIVPPNFVIACARNTMPARTAELMLTTGKLFTTDEALKIGLIDEIASSKDEATAQCEKFLLRFSKIPPMARALTKQSYRKDSLDLLRKPQNRSASAKAFIDHMLRPSTQKDIENYVASLKKK